MTIPLLTLKIHYEQDVVLTRQLARQLSELLGFDAQDQARIATGVSEIARNSFQYAKGGTVKFWVDEDASSIFWIQVQDTGPGIANLPAILRNQYQSTTGMGLGITGTRRLMDEFEITSTQQGTTVVLGKTLPKRGIPLNAQRLAAIREEISQRSPQNPFEEIQHQNQELLRAMAELRKREEELTQLNRELEDTNRGVVALYAELNEKADSLQRANEVKSRFLSNMSHEFRTPLNSIMSLSRILLDRIDGDLSSEQEKQVTLIQKSASGLSDLVNDLLDLAKVEAGKIVAHPSEFDISGLFGTLRGMLRPLLAHNSSVVLIFEEPTGIPALYTDEGKVAQILRNLISNALKFTQQGEIRITAALQGHRVIFSVTDTGIGIASGDQEHIFDDFVQIDSPLQSQFKGTGLGLPLSRRLAELLGGQISLTSEPGKGSTFIATIPLVYPGTAHSSEMLPAEWQLDPSRLPILAIEDNAETLLIYEKYLQDSPYQLIRARTLTQAQQVLQTLQPAAILLDILLEGQSTWDFLQATKSQEATRHIPILVATVVDNEKQAIARGADSFLIKPVDRLPLLKKLNTLIQQETHPLQKLLVVDDDLTARYVFKQLLARAPVTVLEAANGPDGLHLAETETPQAIILDLAMPEMDGREFLDRLQQQPTTCKIPVIINTSQSLAVEEQKYLSEHTVAILSKETPSQAVAIAQLQEALSRAGLILEI